MRAVTEQVFVVVGGGPCAASAVATLRSAGFDGRLVLIAEEPIPPYARARLSKDYLTGRVDSRELAVEPRSWYAEHDVELWLGERAETVDDREHTVWLASGDQLGYDVLLLATGGRPRPFTSVDADKVGYLRSLADADRLAQRLRRGEPLVVLGGGFIGCEAAAVARQLGVEVTLFEMAQTPLQAALGTELGDLAAEIHREAGVEVRTGERVLAVSESAGTVIVHTERGELECGHLLVAVGMMRNTALLQDSSVACDNGVLVDEHCRTSVPNIFAAGDVTAHFHPRYGRRMRVDHHDNAIRHGAVAARNMLGANIAYDAPHWFWTDQYEHRFESIGSDEGCDESVVRGSVADRSFSRFALAQGRVRRVVALNREDDVLAGRKLIATGVEVVADRLRDESVDLQRVR